MAVRTLLILLVLIACSGCRGIQPRSDWDREASFNRLHGFTVLPGPKFEESEPVSDPFVSPLVIERARKVAEQVLYAKGFVPTERERADFWVVAHVATKERIEVYTTYGHGYHHRGWWRDGTTVGSSYTEGTLILDIVSARSEQLIWRGWVSEPLSATGPDPDRVRDIVVAILGQFPPAPGTASDPD